VHLRRLFQKKKEHARSELQKFRTSLFETDAGVLNQKGGGRVGQQGGHFPLARKALRSKQGNNLSSIRGEIREMLV
jgi:hypothetical protein